MGRLGTGSEMRMDPWRWFQARRGVRLSYAIGFMCLLEVVVWSGASAGAVFSPHAAPGADWQNDGMGSANAAGADIVELHRTLRASAENLKKADVHSIGLSGARSTVSSLIKSAEVALVPVQASPPRGPATTKTTTGGEALNPRRSPASSSAQSAPGSISNSRRRMGSMMGSSVGKKSSKPPSAGETDTTNADERLENGAEQFSTAPILAIFLLLAMAPAVAVGRRLVNSTFSASTPRLARAFPLPSNRPGRQTPLISVPNLKSTLAGSELQGLKKSNAKLVHHNYGATAAVSHRSNRAGLSVSTDNGTATKSTASYGSLAAPITPDKPPLEVKVHDHDLLEVLSRPSEVFAGLRYQITRRRNDRSNFADSLDKLVSRTNISAELSDLAADAEFCDGMLVQTSRSFAAVIQQLPSDIRASICIFYLVLRALDTIEDDMEGPTSTKLVLLRSFHEQITDPSFRVDDFGYGDEKVLLQELPKVLRILSALPADQYRSILQCTQEMGHGMAEFAERDLGEGTSTIAEYNEYCRVAAGLVGQGLSKIFGASGLESQSIADETELSNNMGLFLQKTNIIRDFLEDYVDGRTWWPAEIYEQHVSSLAELAHQPVGSDDNSDDFGAKSKKLHCLNHMITDALELVPDCVSYMQKLQDPKIVTFCAIPQLMAIATQAELYGNEAVFTGIVKIRTGLAAKLILAMESDPSAACVQRWFAHFARDLVSKVDINDPNAGRTFEALRAILAACQESV